MMKKVLLILGSVLLLLFLGKVGYEVNKSLSRELGVNIGVIWNSLRPSPPPVGSRNIPASIKAVLPLPPIAAEATVKEFGEDLKKMGVNTIQINTFTPNFDTQAIVEAKKQGFAVWVALDSSVAGVKFPYDFTFDNEEKWLNELMKKAVEYGKIAEEYRVEFYTPLTEPDLILANNGFSGEKRNQELAHIAGTIYPKVREVFKGTLIAKVSEGRVATPQPSREQPDFEAMWTAEAKGADILGLDFLPPAQNLDDYRQMIKEQFVPASKISAKLHIPWVIAEYEYMRPEGNGADRRKSSWDTQTLQMVFSEFLGSQPRPFGFSFNNFNFRDFIKGEENKSVKEAFREFYSKF